MSSNSLFRFPEETLAETARQLSVLVISKMVLRLARGDDPHTTPGPWARRKISIEYPLCYSPIAATGATHRCQACCRFVSVGAYFSPKSSALPPAKPGC